MAPPFAHEESHIEDIKKDAPNICKGQPRGVLAGADEGEQKKNTEKTYKAEMACLKKLKESD